MSQTEQKLQGQRSIAEGIVSFHDPEARPIRKGKLTKAVEFGRTLQLIQDSSGVNLHYEIEQEIPVIGPNCCRCCATQKPLWASSSKNSRGYYSAENMLKVRQAGIEKVGIPKKGRLSQTEKLHQRKTWFRQLQPFRCGIEASISMPKCKFVLGRVLAKGCVVTAI